MGESIREWCKTHVKVVITNKYLNADFAIQELVALVLLFVILLAGGGIFRAIERDAWQMAPNLSGTPTNLTFIDSVYWATVTLTTIGMLQLCHSSSSPIYRLWRYHSTDAGRTSVYRVLHCDWYCDYGQCCECIPSFVQICVKNCNAESNIKAKYISLFCFSMYWRWLQKLRLVKRRGFCLVWHWWHFMLLLELEFSRSLRVGAMAMRCISPL